MNLHYCKGQDSLAARILRAPEDAMILRTGRDIPLAIKALQDSRDVLAIANPATTTGWRAPEGTVITLDDGIEPQMAEQARHRVALPGDPFGHPQIEGRLYRPGGAPVRIVRYQDGASGDGLRDYQAEAMAAIERAPKLNGDAFKVRAHAGLGKFAPDPVIEDPFEADAEADGSPAGPRL
ncbi:hypothetical protein [Paracoccus sp. ME4]|uniref:hypothetical protein n=1 Tax=Paracoccus sp. ME4 TaxID=3138066 RepID=UPI00398BA6E1